MSPTKHYLMHKHWIACVRKNSSFNCTAVGPSGTLLSHICGVSLSKETFTDSAIGGKTFGDKTGSGIFLFWILSPSNIFPPTNIQEDEMKKAPWWGSTIAEEQRCTSICLVTGTECFSSKTSFTLQVFMQLSWLAKWNTAIYKGKEELNISRVIGTVGDRVAPWVALSTVQSLWWAEVLGATRINECFHPLLLSKTLYVII